MKMGQCVMMERQGLRLMKLILELLTMMKQRLHKQLLRQLNHKQ
jgi:hypothetical protein